MVKDPRRIHVLARSWSLALALALASGCASQPVRLTPHLLAPPQRLGKAEGESCGLNPLNVSFRLEDAYGKALASVPGATALDEVTINENWFYAGATFWCTNVSGEAVR